MNADREFDRFKLIHDKYAMHQFLKSLKYTNNKHQVASTLKSLTSRKSPFYCEECGIMTEEKLLHLTTECVKSNHIRDTLTDDLINYFSIDLYLYIENCDNETVFNILLGKQLPTHLFQNIDDSYQFHKLCANFVSRIARL